MKEMGVNHFYVNHDKRQYFLTGLWGYSSRSAAIGQGPGARALAILLSDRGVWQGDRISVVADTSPVFAELQENGVDIEIEAELMLLGLEPLSIAECGDSAFTRLCAYAVLLRHPEAIQILDTKHGPHKWLARYNKSLQHNTDLRSQRVLAARERALRLLKTD
jgi:hypothetical protein